MTVANIGPAAVPPVPRQPKAGEIKGPEPKATATGTMAQLRRPPVPRAKEPGWIRKPDRSGG
jgi:hypothetical protein